MCEARWVSNPPLSGNWMVPKFSQLPITGMWQLVQRLPPWILSLAAKAAWSLWQSWHCFLSPGMV